MTITGKTLNEIQPGKFLRIDKINPAGSLEARKRTSGGVIFYWRVTLKGKTERHHIGTYDSSAPPKALTATSKGFSIAAAKRAAEDLANMHDRNREIGGLTAVKLAKKQSVEAAVIAEQQAKEFTLSKLLDKYCDYLEKKGRRSHKDARSIFQLHIKEPFPKSAAQPANSLPMERFVEMMRRLQVMGHGRTSNKLRSYVRAAFEVARHAKADATIPAAFLDFGVVHNPLADTVIDTSANKFDKNPLSIEQMRVYWDAIKDLDGLHGSVLRLHLLTGAQRIEQFVKLQTDEIKNGEILLWDGKGKPGKGPRKNPVPLIPAAVIALTECRPTGKFALTTDAGTTHIHATTLLKWAQAAVGTKIPKFKAKQLRSGVETLLASLKIPTEIRGRLQSHGIAGVQNNSYNGHEYMDEQREALLILYEHLIKSRATLIGDNVNN